MISRSAFSLIALVAVQAAWSQGYRTELLSHTTVAMTTGDLDGDGDIDIISGGIQNLVWNENQGDGTFERRTISLDPQEVQCVLMVDLDQDGHQDIVLADMAANSILYFRNNGDQTFDRFYLATQTQGTSSIAVADVDGDGDLDVVGAAFTGNRVYWLRNDGGFAFTNIAIATGLNQVAHVLAEDFDGDGDVDVVAALQGAGTIRLFRNNGTGVFSSEIINVISTPRRLVAEDVDQDGDLDILYAGGGGLGYFRNNAGTFVQQSIFTYNATRGVAMADMNGDGYKDLLFADYVEEDMKVIWFNTATGDFSGSAGVTLDTDFDYASMIMAADLDNDGRMDAVCGSSFDVRVYINQGGGVFQKRPLNRYLGGSRGICHGDFDNDGDIDIMAIGGLYINWYVNDGTGHYEARILRQGPARIQVGGGIYMKTADMDGDGDDDVVFTERSGNKISWIENLGGGSFTKRLVHFLEDAYALDVIDFDGDGDMDAVASNLNGGFVYWYENDGNQVFTQRTINTTYRRPFEVRALDYDNDGDTDVLATAYSSLQLQGKVLIHRNMGNGNFQVQEVDADAPNTTSVSWVDMDGDGDIDILASMADSDRINWYENNGDPIPFFIEHVLAYGVGFATYAVSADLDGDGDMDVVATGIDDRSTDWFENDGDQVFTRRQLARNIRNPQFIGVADTNNDGVLEIYATCMETDAVHLYHRTGITNEQVIGPAPTPCHDLFISEMVHQPGDAARALEIYNPRSVPVDLTGYALRFYPNGQNTYDATMLTGVIQPGDVHIVVAPNFDTDIDSYADQMAYLWFDGSDAIVLVKDGVPIDIIGKVGEAFDDDDYWFNNGVGTFYTVLVRKPTIQHGDVNGTDEFLPDVEWIAYDVDDYSHLGSHDAPCAAVCTPTINIAAQQLTVCPGEDVTFTATVASGGAAPIYQWTVNGAPVGGSSSTFSATDLQADALVQCMLESNAGCATAMAVESNTLLIDVQVVLVPVASIVGNVVTASPVPNATYQWYVDGDLLSGANTQSITATIPGDYTVIATVDGCASSSSNSVLYQITTGMYMATVPGFALVPNPTDGPLTIRMDANIESVEVWNAAGQRVLVQRDPAIDLSGMAPGMYHVVVISAGERRVGRVLLH
jgi:hypothetical protein